MQRTDYQEDIEKQLQRDLLRTPILKLAKKHNYDEIWYILGKKDIDVRKWLNIGLSTSGKKSVPITEETTDDDDNDSLLNTDTCVINQFKGETTLHQIMQYQPPVEIIDLLIQRMIQYNDNINRKLKRQTLPISYNSLHHITIQDWNIVNIYRMMLGFSISVTIKFFFYFFPSSSLKVSEFRINFNPKNIFLN